MLVYMTMFVSLMLFSKYSKYIYIYISKVWKQPFINTCTIKIMPYASVIRDFCNTSNFVLIDFRAAFERVNHQGILIKTAPINDTVSIKSITAR